MVYHFIQCRLPLDDWEHGLLWEIQEYDGTLGYIGACSLCKWTWLKKIYIFFFFFNFFLREGFSNSMKTSDLYLFLFCFGSKIILPLVLFPRKTNKQTNKEPALSNTVVVRKERFSFKSLV